jgi:hypothetical protein
MMLTYQQERKMNNQASRCFHLYAYLSVLMQMEMSYTNKARIVAFLRVIANKVQGLQTELDKVLSKATTSYEYEGGEDIRNDSEAWGKIEALKKINQQYSNIRGACELIGIELKTKYSVHDVIAFANKV